MPIQDFFLKYLGATAAVVLIIGPFFGGHLRPENTVTARAHMLSTMRYHTSVVISLFGALGTLGASSRKVMRLSAFADRITQMEMTVKEVASSSSGGWWVGVFLFFGGGGIRSVSSTRRNSRTGP